MKFPRHVQDIIDFIETLPVPDGDKAGQSMVLRPWQKDFIRKVYGPRHKDGRRKVRQAVLSMPRKNGKTALVSALTLVHLIGPEAKRNGQLYSMAFDLEQSGVSFNYTCKSIYMDEELAERVRVLETHKRLIDPKGGSEFKALTRDSRTKHGKSTSFLICDELAQFGMERKLYDTMMTSTGAHEDALTIVISTQAADDNALLSELIDYGQSVNAGEINDDSFVCVVYSADQDADIWDEKVWRGCNPALGDFRSLNEMRDYAQKARRMPGMVSSFRNLYLNQRIDSTSTFIDREIWSACGGKPDTAPLADGAPCYAGVDLSQKNDLTALALAWTVEDQSHCELWFWKPGDLLREHQDRDRAPYMTWRDSGHIIAPKGRIIDLASVAKELVDLHRQYNLRMVACDPYKLEDLRKAISNLDDAPATVIAGKEPEVEGALVLVVHSQGYRDMSDAVQALEDELSKETLRHGSNPVLTMCAANVVVESDAMGNRRWSKKKSHKRIDGITALSMALNLKYKKRDEDKPAGSVYESRGIRTL
jgi:phage terminase large subunit-like protein